MLNNLLVHKVVKYESVLPQTSNLGMAQHVAHTDSEDTQHECTRMPPLKMHLNHNPRTQTN